MRIEHYLQDCCKEIPEQQKWWYLIAEDSNEDFLLGRISQVLPGSGQGIPINGHQSLAFTTTELVYKILEPKTVISED